MDKLKGNHFDSRYRQAIRLASAVHDHQKYGPWPYIYHLGQVAGVLSEFGIAPILERDCTLLIAAWLHDVVEDCYVGIELIEKQFGPAVATLVWAVTNEPGKNRAEKHEKTLPKILATKDALILKLADRIANVRESTAHNPTLFNMYLKEWPEFRAVLQEAALRDPVASSMWQCLQELFSKPDSPSVSSGEET